MSRSWRRSMHGFGPATGCIPGMWTAFRSTGASGSSSAWMPACAWVRSGWIAGRPTAILTGSSRCFAGSSPRRRGGMHRRRFTVCGRGALWDEVREGRSAGARISPPCLRRAGRDGARFLSSEERLFVFGFVLCAWAGTKTRAVSCDPLDRLLVETDAPAMQLPPELDRHPLPRSNERAGESSGQSRRGLRGARAPAGMPLAELAAAVAGKLRAAVRG